MADRVRLTMLVTVGIAQCVTGFGCGESSPSERAKVDARAQAAEPPRSDVKLSRETRSIVRAISAWRSLNLAEHPTAVKLAKEAVSLDANSAFARFQLGRSLLVSGKPSEAAEHYEAAGAGLRADGVQWAAISQTVARDWKQARAAFEQRIGMIAPNYVTLCLVPADAGPAAFDVQRSTLFWSKFARDNPDQAIAHWFYGNSLAGSGREAEASDSYGRAKALDPGFPPLRVSMAASLVRAKQHEEAVVALNEILKDWPDLAGARMLRAESLEALKRFPESFEDYKALLAQADRQGSGDRYEWLMAGAARTARYAGLDAEASRLLDRISLVFGTTNSILNIDRNTLLEELDNKSVPAAMDYVLYSNALLDRSRNAVNIVGFDPGAMPDSKSADTASYYRLIDSGNENSIAMVRGMGLMINSVAPTAVTPANNPQLTNAFKVIHTGLVPVEPSAASIAAWAGYCNLVGRSDDANAAYASLRKLDRTALGAWYMYAANLPLDLAPDCLESLDESSRRHRWAREFEASVAIRSGRAPDAIGPLTSLIAEEGWSAPRLWWLGRAIEAAGDDENAYEVLQAAAGVSGDSAGLLALARVQERLGRDDPTSTYILAWRNAGRDTDDETIARAAIGKRSTQGYICARCNGAGTVQQVSGGEYSVWTENVNCPQCYGLGLHTDALK